MATTKRIPRAARAEVTDTSKEVIVTNPGLTAQLIEGRSSGITFGFLNPLGDNKFELIQPLSSCKDYLNDIIFTEHTGKTIKVFGLETVKKYDLFKNERLYLAVSHKKLDEPITKKFLEGIDTIVKHINDIENKYIKELTTYLRVQDNPNIFVFEVPKFWGSTTYLISLYSFIIRTAFLIKNGDSYVEFLKKAMLDSNLPYPLSMETSYMPRIYLKLKQAEICGSLNFLAYQDFDYFISKAPNLSTSIHNCGIMQS